MKYNVNIMQYFNNIILILQYQFNRFQKITLKQSYIVVYKNIRVLEAAVPHIHFGDGRVHNAL